MTLHQAHPLTPPASGSTGNALPSCHQCGKRRTVKGKSRCARCLEARRLADRQRTKDIAEAVFPPALQEEVLKLLAAGESFAAVLERLQVSQQQVFSFRAHDPRWGERVDTALMAGRDESLRHGAESTYTRHRCRCPECRAAKVRSRSGQQQPRLATGKEMPSPQERFLTALEKGLTQTAAAQRARVPEQAMHDKRRRDRRFDEEVRAALARGRDCLLAAAVAEIAAGGQAKPVLEAAGRAPAFLYYQMSKDPVLHRAYTEAKETAAAVAEAERHEKRLRKEAEQEKIRAGKTVIRLTAKEQRRADMAAKDREVLARLLPLLREGMTLQQAVERLSRRREWLTRLRSTVPEARQQIEEAYQAGARIRAQRREARKAATPTPTARAMQLIVAAVASGASLPDACKAGGAAQAWVAGRYHRDDTFRHALGSTAALHPHLDLHEWLANVPLHQGNLPIPRPPRPAQDVGRRVGADVESDA